MDAKIEVRLTLDTVLERGVSDYWIVNCSNIKPHVFTLWLIARLWRDGTANSETILQDYAAEYYGASYAGQIASCFRAYYNAALSYGPHEDDRAGEQFSNYVPRMLVSQYMSDKEQHMPSLRWATDADTLRGQIEWFAELFCQGAARYAHTLDRCEEQAPYLPEAPQCLFRDSILLQTQLYERCYWGAALVCRSLLEALDGEYRSAFYHAGLAREAYAQANAAMRGREHGKWQGFYANECLTDVKQTAWLLDSYMGFLRNKGDGPYFYTWQRELLYPPEDVRVILITNMENHLTDQELFSLMKEKWRK